MNIIAGSEEKLQNLFVERPVATSFLQTVHIFNKSTWILSSFGKICSNGSWNFPRSYTKLPDREGEHLNKGQGTLCCTRDIPNGGGSTWASALLKSLLGPFQQVWKFTHSSFVSIYSQPPSTSFLIEMPSWSNTQCLYPWWWLSSWKMQTSLNDIDDQNSLFFSI